MLRNFNLNLNIWPPSNPRALMRLGLGVLIAANLIAGYFVIRPIGGSPDELRQQVIEMRIQIHQQQGALDRMRQLAEKIKTGRGEGEDFTAKYFLPRRTAYSTIMDDLNQAANEAKINPRETATDIVAIDGSETLDMMRITINFDGSYADVIHFINLIDKSNRMLIMESLNASPQQGGTRLNVQMKLDTFVVEGGSST